MSDNYMLVPLFGIKDNTLCNIAPDWGVTAEADREKARDGAHGKARSERGLEPVSRSRIASRAS
jgi:hypothetical protein